MALSGSVEILAGQTVVNQINGLTLNASLDGLDGSSVFENQGEVDYTPTPMICR
jgi:hypothetical protein